MKTIPFISFIIPIYNSEKYLEQCIESVLNQTYTDFELILINDGSTDQSGEICEKFAAGDYRIKLFHKANGGVSSARNLGLQVVTGQWITFVDSDDFLLKDFLNDFLSFFNPQIELLIQGLSNLKYDGSYQKGTGFETNKIISPVDFLNLYNNIPHFLGPVNKLFNREIIERNKIRFDETKSYGEDALFNLDYLNCCKNKIVLINRNNYVVRDVPGSLSKKILNYNERISLFTGLKKRLEVLTQNKDLYNWYSIELIRALYRDKSIKNKKAVLKRLVQSHKNELLAGYSKPDDLSKFIRFLIKAECIYILNIVFNRFYRNKQ